MTLQLLENQLIGQGNLPESKKNRTLNPDENAWLGGFIHLLSCKVKALSENEFHSAVLNGKRNTPLHHYNVVQVYSEEALTQDGYQTAVSRIMAVDQRTAYDISIHGKNSTIYWRIIRE